MDINQLSGKIIGAAIEVHKGLGPGLLESTYEECLCYEFKLSKMAYERQKTLPVVYKGVIKLDCGYRIDVIAENMIILELKACEKIEPVHKAQLLTYPPASPERERWRAGLKLSGLKLGLLINFNVPVLKDGIVRIVNQLEE